MSRIIVNLLIGVAAGAIVAIVGTLLFNRDMFYRRFALITGRNLRRAFDRISTRSQVLACFKTIFISDVSGHAGQILLMSHTGGYPEYDPFYRLLELSGNARLVVHAALTEHTVRSYLASRPDILEGIVRSANIHLYTFSDMTPYAYRVGVNTHIKLGFFCTYFGHNDNRVSLEGIRSENPAVIGAIEALFWGLLRTATKVTEEWLKS